MANYEIILPTQPRVVLEEDTKGVYEIDGLYAGYGHTLGNSLRRVMLSSIPGAAITTVKIDGVNHEFSTIEGVKEDVIMIILNLKQARFKLLGDEPQTASLSVKGPKTVTVGDFKIPPQLQALNKDKVIASLTNKNKELKMEITVEKGLGYVPREVLKKEKVEVGTLMLDAIFTPIRRVNYEVENMRVGERTDYNRLRFVIETDGSITPREVLDNAIQILTDQLNAVSGTVEKKAKKTLNENEKVVQKTETAELPKDQQVEEVLAEGKKKEKEMENDFLKTRTEDLSLSARTLNSLTKAGIRTVGGLSKKREEDLLKVEGLGKKSLTEIRRALGNFGLILK